MKLRLLLILTSLLGLAYLVPVLLGTNARGQASASKGEENLKPLPDGGPTPRLSNGRPDLSGIWYVGLLGRESANLVGSRGALSSAVLAFDPKVTPQEKPSFQPWAMEKIQHDYGFLLNIPAGGGQPIDLLGLSAFKKLPLATQLAMVDDALLHLSRNCTPEGIPAIGGGNHGMQLVQTPAELVELVETNHDYRVIPTDGRALPKDPDPKFNGNSVGHWDGDTLVIDTIGIDERVWNNELWRFHSDQEHIIERYTRPSRNFLLYQITIEDPKVLTKPWTSAPHRFSLSVTNEPLNEWYCGVSTSDEEVNALKDLKQQLTAEMSKQSGQ